MQIKQNIILEVDMVQHRNDHTKNVQLEHHMVKIVWKKIIYIMDHQRGGGIMDIIITRNFH